MLRVLGCITDQHDLRLVLLAGLICAMACYTSFSLAARVRVSDIDPSKYWARYAWLCAAAFVTGSGVWATHFVAELAFRPGLPVAYDISLTILSILVCVVLSGIGFALWLRRRKPIAGGAMIGIAVAAMHYTGMAALRVPARLDWDWHYVAASIVISVLFAAFATLIADRGNNLRERLAASVVLVLGIVLLHFTGMTAVSLTPDPTIAIPDQSLQPNLLAIAVSAISVLIVGLGLFGSIVDQHLAHRNAREAEQLRRHVTALEATKADLEAAAVRLRYALQAKSLFLAAMSHELRTPLNAVIGFAEVLKKEIYGPVENARYREYHEDIYNSGAHLLTLINGILDISKLEAGQLELVESEFDLHVAICDCVKNVEEQARAADIALTLDLDSAHAQCVADERRVRQIVVNILSNALKFTPKGGKVRVSTRHNENDFEIRIADTGIGMAADDIPKALELFQQIDNSLARKFEGAGLGLPIAKQLAENHGGTLAIVSAQGQGTTVSVTLPGSRFRKVQQAA